MQNLYVIKVTVLLISYIFTIISEREENVKADIFNAYITLLKQTKPSVTTDPDAMEHDTGCVVYRITSYYTNRNVFKNDGYLSFPDLSHCYKHRRHL